MTIEQDAAADSNIVHLAAQRKTASQVADDLRFEPDPNEARRWAFAEPENQAYRLGALDERLAGMRAAGESEDRILNYERGARDQLRRNADHAAALREVYAAPDAAELAG